MDGGFVEKSRDMLKSSADALASLGREERPQRRGRRAA